MICRSTSLKFLGVIVDENLNWKDHIDTVENLLSKNIGVLYRANRLLPRNCAKKLYYAFIHSHVAYANIVWGSCYKSYLNQIHLKQKHAIRIIFQKDRLAHSRPLMRQLQALNVYQLNIYQIILFVFKTKIGITPITFQNIFSHIEHNYPTRFSKNNLQLHRSSRTPKFSILLRGPKLWNEILTDEEKQTMSFVSFKYILKHKLF